MESNTRKQMKYRIRTYTREQKLVATVWYHERLYTGMTYDQLCTNFMVRFKSKFPKYSTLKTWEKRLFKEGLIDDKLNKPRTNLSRLVYVPYVKESLERFPNISTKARSQLLGISPATLQCILKHDLAENYSPKNEGVNEDNSMKDNGDDHNPDKSELTQNQQPSNVLESCQNSNDIQDNHGSVSKSEMNDHNMNEDVKNYVDKILINPIDTDNLQNQVKSEMFLEGITIKTEK